MRFLFQRPLTLLTAAIIASAIIHGGTQAGQNTALLAAVLWGVAIILRRVWARHRIRRRTPRALIAKPSRSSPWGRRDSDVSGCFARLDPEWRHWLQPDEPIDTKGIHRA